MKLSPRPVSSWAKREESLACLLRRIDSLKKLPNKKASLHSGSAQRQRLPDSAHTCRSKQRHRFQTAGNWEQALPNTRHRILRNLQVVVFVIYTSASFNIPNVSVGLHFSPVRTFLCPCTENQVQRLWQLFKLELFPLRRWTSWGLSTPDVDPGFLVGYLRINWSAVQTYFMMSYWCGAIPISWKYWPDNRSNSYKGLQYSINGILSVAVLRTCLNWIYAEILSRI